MTGSGKRQVADHLVSTQGARITAHPIRVSGAACAAASSYAPAKDGTWLEWPVLGPWHVHVDLGERSAKGQQCTRPGVIAGVICSRYIYVRCTFAMHSDFQTKNTTQTAAKNIITAKILAMRARLLEIEFRYFKSSAWAPCTLLSISSTFESILQATV